MRKGRRQKEEGRIKKSIYLYGMILLVLIATTVITFTVYNNKLEENMKSSLTTEQLTGIIPSLTSTDIAQTSSEMGKTIQEVINDTEENEEAKASSENIISTNIEPEVPETKKEEIIEEVIIPDPEFIIPAEGEIVKEYAKDNLTFSETLQEWITHNGIDIKADRTSVVKSAEKGKIIAIKNDPRYGLTIIVEHLNNFKTVYSNLLTTEFVSEGEEVTKGQSLGTVGNSAIFEIADEPHLHFEILKDDTSIDPTIYLK